MITPHTSPSRRRRIRLVAALFTLGLIPASVLPPGSPASAAPGDWTVMPTLIDFGDVPVGGYAEQDVVITNVSTTTQSPSFTLAQPTGADFFMESTACTGSAMSPGASCEITYSFTPDDVGFSSGAVTFGIDAETWTISFEGNGVSGLSVAPTTLDFGQVEVGATSAPQDVVVTNTSGGALSVQWSGPLLDGEFNRLQADPFTGCWNGVPLQPGETCSFVYTFAPASTGPKTDSETIPINGEAFTISLTGEGAAPPCQLTSSDDAYSTTQEMTLDVAAPGVFGNDAEHCGGGLNNFTQPANGMVTVDADGALSYQPDAGFVGVDSFEYIVTAPYPVAPPGNASAVVAIAVEPTEPTEPTETTEPTEPTETTEPTEPTEPECAPTTAPSTAPTDQSTTTIPADPTTTSTVLIADTTTTTSTTTTVPLVEISIPPGLFTTTTTTTEPIIVEWAGSRAVGFSQARQVDQVDPCTTPTTPTTPSTPSTPGGSLPATGWSPVTIVALGALLVACGGAALVVVRRRTSP